MRKDRNKKKQATIHAYSRKLNHIVEFELRPAKPPKAICESVGMSNGDQGIGD